MNRLTRQGGKTLSLYYSGSHPSVLSAVCGRPYSWCGDVAFEQETAVSCLLKSSLAYPTAIFWGLRQKPLSDQRSWQTVFYYLCCYISQSNEPGSHSGARITLVQKSICPGPRIFGVSARCLAYSLTTMDSKLTSRQFLSKCGSPFLKMGTMIALVKGTHSV